MQNIKITKTTLLVATCIIFVTLLAATFQRSSVKENKEEKGSPPASLVATSTPEPTTTKKPSQALTELVELVRGCRVESISYTPTYGDFVGFDSIILKDGTFFASSSLITREDQETLITSVLSVKDKCRIRMSQPRLDR